MEKLILLTPFLTLFNLSIFGQNNQINCYKIFHQIDRMLLEKDTSTAIFLYEAIEEGNCNIRKSWYFRMSAVYHVKGEVEKSKQDVQFAIENGFLGRFYFDQAQNKIPEILRKKYGDDFTQKMMSLNQRLINDKMKKHGSLIYELKDIYEKDQELRKNKDYKECKSYEFRQRLGFPTDSTLSHQQMMSCFKEFKQKDSILLQRFVDIVDSLGHVPGDEIVFGMIPISPIVNHTSHFKFPHLDRMYLQSVWQGTLTPEVYAWWQGYHEEYFKKEHQLYFTHAVKNIKEFSEEKKEEINKKRMAIGLPLIPAVIWNVRRFE